MSGFDPDHDGRQEQSTDLRFDNWPVTRYDEDRPAERATPREEGTLHELAEEADEDSFSWLGVTGAGYPGGTPVVYDPSESAVYEGDIDEEESRVVLREDASHDVDSDASLGERIEEIGDEHGWHWLSSFAREHLEDDRAAELRRDLTVRDSVFQQRELLESSPADVAFNASHTLEDETGQVYVIERRFTVADLDGDPVHVDVEESYHVAEPPREHERAGDAEIVAEREYGLEGEVDPDSPTRKAAVENELRSFHESRGTWPGEA